MFDPAEPDFGGRNAAIVATSGAGETSLEALSERLRAELEDIDEPRG